AIADEDAFDGLAAKLGHRLQLDESLMSVLVDGGLAAIELWPTTPLSEIVAPEALHGDAEVSRTRGVANYEGIHPDLGQLQQPGHELFVRHRRDAETARRGNDQPIEPCADQVQVRGHAGLRTLDTVMRDRVGGRTSLLCLGPARIPDIH